MAPRLVSKSNKVLKKEKELGVGEEGYKADLVIWNLDSLESIPYAFDNTDKNILNIIKNGEVVLL